MVIGAPEMEPSIHNPAVGDDSPKPGPRTGCTTSNPQTLNSPFGGMETGVGERSPDLARALPHVPFAAEHPAAFFWGADVRRTAVDGKNRQWNKTPKTFFRWGWQNGLAYLNSSNPEPKSDTQAIISVVNIAFV